MSEDTSLAIERAREGADAWSDVARYQRGANPDHADFYVIAGELVQTVAALQDMTQVLRRQVEGYAEGRDVYDDLQQMDPKLRLAEAAGYLLLTRDALETVYKRANAFWSAIGHIGVQVPS
jgi:hypothetical protein